MCLPDRARAREGVVVRGVCCSHTDRCAFMCTVLLWASMCALRFSIIFDARLSVESGTLPAAALADTELQRGSGARGHPLSHVARTASGYFLHHPDGTFHCAWQSTGFRQHRQLHEAFMGHFAKYLSAILPAVAQVGIQAGLSVPAARTILHRPRPRGDLLHV